MPIKPTLFISYRRKATADLARYLHHRLSSLSYDTFLDVETINGGRFANIIQREIINRDVFVVILTPETLESEWVVREIKTALEHEKSIIPLMAQGFSFATPLPDEIKDLGNYDAVRWDHDFADAAFERLGKAIDPTYGQVAPQKSKPGMSTEIKVAIIGGIFVVIAAAIGILPSLLSPAPIITPTTAQIVAVPSNTPSPTDTIIPATDTPAPSNTPIPTVVIQPSTTATIVYDLSVTQTEAILQRTADVIQQTNAAMFAESTQIAQTATAHALPTITNTPTQLPTATRPLPTATLPTAYPCPAVITGASGVLLNQVRVRPQPTGNLVNPVAQASTVTIMEAPVNDFGKTWYRIEYNNKQNTGWIESKYINPSSSCPT